MTEVPGRFEGSDLSSGGCCLYSDRGGGGWGIVSGWFGITQEGLETQKPKGNTDL